MTVQIGPCFFIYFMLDWTTGQGGTSALAVGTLLVALRSHGPFDSTDSFLFQEYPSTVKGPNWDQNMYMI